MDKQASCARLFEALGEVATCVGAGFKRARYQFPLFDNYYVMVTPAIEQWKRLNVFFINQQASFVGQI